MKNTKLLLISALTMFVVALALTTSGCKKEETVTGPVDEFVQGDLFPLAPGNKITYSGFLRQQSADTNITATGAVYQTIWTVVNLNATVPGPPVGPGGTAVQLLDSTRVPSGVANPPFVWQVNPLFIKKEVNGSFSYLTSIGLFYRTLGIQSSDSLKWILLANTSIPLGKTWEAFSGTYTSPAVGPAKLVIAGEWVGKETITTPGGTFNTYKLVTRRDVFIPPTSPTPVPGSGALTASVWIVAGTGPVKVILHADGESYGHYRELKSKNF